ncbi:MAG TPA: hypothetical protein VHV75_00255 [Solirubrobacteraceae bacterium]|nr:hypothetical protein [Solirubrobacteraceae bacterium]
MDSQPTGISLAGAVWLLTALDDGKKTTDTYVLETWIPVHAQTLAAKTPAFWR